MASEPLPRSVAEFRRLWDSQHGKVDPHVTVVHPHDPTALPAKDLGPLIVRDLKPIPVVFSGAEVDGDYLYLPVESGMVRIVALAERVRSVSGLSAEDVTQRPHMTIGRHADIRDALSQARDLPPVRTVLDLLVIEQYGEDDVSIPVFTHELGC